MVENIPGAMQAISTITVGYPFDTVKSHMQHAHHRNSYECIRHIFQKGGIKAFYRGATIPYVTLIPKRAIQFRVYEHLKQKYNPYMAGFGAALSMCWISSPMQNIKLNMQIQHKYENALQYLKYTHTHHGILGFYRGFRITLLRDFTFGTIYLGTYSLLKEKFETQGNRYTGPFLAGGFSSIVTWTILLPIDHIKTIYQTNPQQTITNIIKSTSPLQYWRSIVPTTIRVFPVSGVSMLTYELFKKLCNN